MPHEPGIPRTRPHRLRLLPSHTAARVPSLKTRPAHDRSPNPCAFPLSGPVDEMYQAAPTPRVWQSATMPHFPGYLGATSLFMIATRTASSRSSARYGTHENPAAGPWNDKGTEPT